MNSDLFKNPMHQNSLTRLKQNYSSNSKSQGYQNMKMKQRQQQNNSAAQKNQRNMDFVSVIQQATDQFNSGSDLFLQLQHFGLQTILVDEQEEGKQKNTIKNKNSRKNNNNNNISSQSQANNNLLFGDAASRISRKTSSLECILDFSHLVKMKKQNSNYHNEMQTYNLNVYSQKDILFASKVANVYKKIQKLNTTSKQLKSLVKKSKQQIRYALNKQKQQVKRVMRLFQKNIKEYLMLEQQRFKNDEVINSRIKAQQKQKQQLRNQVRELKKVKIQLQTQKQKQKQQRSKQLKELHQQKRLHRQCLQKISRLYKQIDKINKQRQEQSLEFKQKLKQKQKERLTQNLEQIQEQYRRQSEVIKSLKKQIKQQEAEIKKYRQEAKIMKNKVRQLQFSQQFNMKQTEQLRIKLIQMEKQKQKQGSSAKNKRRGNKQRQQKSNQSQVDRQRQKQRNIQIFNRFLQSIQMLEQEINQLKLREKSQDYSEQKDQQFLQWKNQIRGQLQQIDYFLMTCQQRQKVLDQRQIYLIKKQQQIKAKQIQLQRLQYDILNRQINDYQTLKKNQRYSKQVNMDRQVQPERQLWRNIKNQIKIRDNSPKRFSTLGRQDSRIKLNKGLASEKMFKNIATRQSQIEDQDQLYSHRQLYKNKGAYYRSQYTLQLPIQAAQRLSYKSSGSPNMNRNSYTNSNNSNSINTQYPGINSRNSQTISNRLSKIESSIANQLLVLGYRH